MTHRAQFEPNYPNNGSHFTATGDQKQNNTEAMSKQYNLGDSISNQHFIHLNQDQYFSSGNWSADKQDNKYYQSASKLNQQSSSYLREMKTRNTTNIYNYNKQREQQSEQQQQWNNSPYENQNKSIVKRQQGQSKVYYDSFSNTNNFGNFDNDASSQNKSEEEADSEYQNQDLGNIYDNEKEYDQYLPNSNRFSKLQMQQGGYQRLSSDNLDLSYKNSDGKHLDENFKRAFAKTLLQKTRNLEKHIANQIIARQAEKIKVYANQVTIWMSIYKIVFSIEYEKSQRRMNDSEIVHQIQSRLVDYLNQHPNEKKYKFIKICNRTFRALRIKKCTGDYWLREMFKKFERKLSPQIDTVTLLKRLNKGFDGDYNPFQDTLQIPSEPKTAKFVDLRCENSFKSENRGSFHAYTKQKVIRKIDQSIEIAISRIFQQKVNQYCVSPEQLKKWYLQFGRLHIFNPKSNYFNHDELINRSFPNNHQLQQMPLGMVPSFSQGYSGPRRVQKQILNFIKMNQSVTRAKVYSFACNIVQKLGVHQLFNQTIFTSWFNSLILNYCTVYNDYIQIKRNPQGEGQEGGIKQKTNSNINLQIPIRNRESQSRENEKKI